VCKIAHPKLGNKISKISRRFVFRRLKFGGPAAIKNYDPLASFLSAESKISDSRLN
jgi:hypothetical protein